MGQNDRHRGFRWFLLQATTISPVVMPQWALWSSPGGALACLVRLGPEMLGVGRRASECWWLSLLPLPEFPELPESLSDNTAGTLCASA